jgi:hypothetical protein
MPANDQAHLPRRRGELGVSKSPHAAAVRCSAWFGVLTVKRPPTASLVSVSATWAAAASSSTEQTGQDATYEARDRHQGAQAMIPNPARANGPPVVRRGLDRPASDELIGAHIGR